MRINNTSYLITRVKAMSVAKYRNAVGFPHSFLMVSPALVEDKIAAMAALMIAKGTDLGKALP